MRDSKTARKDRYGMRVESMGTTTKDADSDAWAATDRTNLSADGDLDASASPRNDQPGSKQ